MKSSSIARAALAGLLATLAVSCGENIEPGETAVPAQEAQSVSADPAVAAAYDTSLRCMVWFALEYNAVSSAQPAQPAETVSLRQGQFQLYRNAVISLGAEMGKSQEAALDEANARSEARLPEYMAQGNTAYDEDAEFCYLDWQQRVIRGDEYSAPAAP